jgi:hypothetical protein
MAILKTSKSLVYDLINRDNPDLPYPLTPDNCRLEKIKAVTPSEATGGRNTSVRIRGAQGEGYEDQFTLFYDRMKISSVIHPAATTQRLEAKFVTFTARTFHQALPIISNTYGVELATWDVTDAALPNIEVPNAISLVTMTMLPTSPAYVGTVVLRLARGKPLLQEGVTQPVLAPCVHPIDPAENKICVDMVTYGLDFTAYKSALVVTGGGMPKWEELRAVLDALDIPFYPAPEVNTVVDQPTSAVLTSNKDFDRVVVHSGINSEGVKGTAYYHYNV